MNTERLKLLIKVLEEAEPRNFDMQWFGHAEPCLTPACVLGHYAIRTDLQTAFILKPDDSGIAGLYDAQGSHLYYDDTEVLDHFDIDDHQAWLLFGTYGCANAKTPQQAIDYIRGVITSGFPDDPH